MSMISLTRRVVAGVGAAAVAVSTAPAASVNERYILLTGQDAGRYPGSNRVVAPVPGPGFPNTFNDGQRLAGTDANAPVVNYQGDPNFPPLFQPNQFGSLSFLFRRGSIPGGATNLIPIQAIEFLGGPRLDLDGDLNNGSRSLVPVGGQTAVAMPGDASFIELRFDTQANTVALASMDATGTNEGGPGQSPQIATIVVTLAGTQSDGTPGAAINPAVDTRVGTLTPFTGTSGTLAGVYRINALGYEIWEDTLLFSATTNPLGTLQYLGTMRGWLIERNAATGQFPDPTGEGLGSTLWPAMNSSSVGAATFNKSTGGAAGITGGIGGDVWLDPNTLLPRPGNGGLALSASGGDLGGYLRTYVLPHVFDTAHRLVYLEAAGWGINNSFDPLFRNTVSYDVVLIAAARCPADTDGNGVVNQDDLDRVLFAFGTSVGQAGFDAGADFDGNGTIDQDDLDTVLFYFGQSCR